MRYALNGFRRIWCSWTSESVNFPTTVKWSKSVQWTADSWAFSDAKIHTPYPQMRPELIHLSHMYGSIHGPTLHSALLRKAKINTLEKTVGKFQP